MKQLIHPLTRVIERAPSMERRMVLRVLNYWRHIAGERNFPAWTDVNGEDIPELWANCYAIAIGTSGMADSVVMVGQELLVDCGCDLAGKPPDQIPEKTVLNAALRHLPQVVQKRVPISMGGEFVDAAGLTVLYRSIALPLSTDGERVSHILGAANCRRVSKE